MKIYLAEAFGTFALVFAGTGAIIINDISGGAITHVGIAATFGLIIMVMIFAVGNISGAHFNPAVTLGFWAARQLPAKQIIPYITSQCAGALLASGILKLIFTSHESLGATFPSGSSLNSFILEIILTVFLMFVILSVTTGKSVKPSMSGLAIGATVGLDALFGGPVSGASMNPARSLAPALVSLNLGFLWIYLTAPCIGAFLSVLLCRNIHSKPCCQGNQSA